MGKEDIRSEVRIKFSRDKSYFGKGTVMLLEEIEKCGNVRTACENCGFVAFNDALTCAKWCKYAEKCLGPEAYERLTGRKAESACQTDGGAV